MNNLKTIEQIREQSESAMKLLSNRTHMHFKVADVDFDGGLVNLNGIAIEGKPLSTVMGAFKAKKEFTAFSHKMLPEDWDSIAQKLKETEGETKMIARVIRDEDGKETISSIFKENETKKFGDSDVNYENYLNWICDSLGRSESNFTLNGFKFNERKSEFGITLLGDSEFNAFDSGKDFWKSGQNFTFNSVSFKAAPFFERLVCSNGNIVKEHGFNTWINQAKFNTEKIKSVIAKSIEENDNSIERILTENINHVKQYNVSLGEFFNYRNFFASKDGKYDSIVEKYFNDRPFYQAYGENIDAKSAKWKSTADTGINAYNFFNMLTYLASHPNEFKLTADDQFDLQVKASNLLFKKELDLEDIATNVRIEYPVLDIMM